MELIVLVVLMFKLSTCSYPVYYVLPQDQNNSICPAGSTKDNCHVLSYYISHFLFTSNSTFYFMEGIHHLNGTVPVIEANNLTFQGLGQWKPSINGLMQSTVVVTCNQRTGGFEFFTSTRIMIKNITFTHCNQSSSFGTLVFYKVDYLHIQMTSVGHSNKTGLGVFNAKYAHIESCSFTRNGYNRTTEAGNVAILSIDQDYTQYRITNVSLTFGSGGYGGLSVIVTRNNNLSLILSDIHAYGNTGIGHTGNVYLSIYNTSIDTVELTGINSTSGQSLTTKSVTTRAGSGISFVFNAFKCSEQSRIVIRRCNINDNKGYESTGLSILMIQTYNCRVNITNNNFISNGNTCCDGNEKLPAALGGGGLGIAVMNSKQNYFIVEDSYFAYNKGLSGGGMTFVGTCDNAILLKNSTFFRNYGFEGVAISHYQEFTSKECNNYLTLEDVKVIENSVLNFSSFSFNNKFYSYASVSHSSAIFLVAKGTKPAMLTNIIVRDNQMSGISVYGCDLVFNGKGNAFINNNSPVIGGGMIISSFNKLIVNEGSHIMFANNTAELYGGALYVKQGNDDDNYVDFRYFKRFPSCSFQTNQSTDVGPPLISFKNNTSHQKIGNDIFGGDFNYCKMSGFPHKNFSSGLDCPLTRYWSMSNKDTITSVPIAICPCNSDNQHNCSLQHLNLQVYPGQIFYLPLVSVGRCGGISSGEIFVEIDDGMLSTTIDNQMTSNECKLFAYEVTPKTVNGKNSTLTIHVNEAKLIQWERLKVSIGYLPCPPGFAISSDTKRCTCDDIISRTGLDIQCHINDEMFPFTRSGKNWIGYLNSYNCTIVYEGCPFDYCNSSVIKFDFTSQELQCNFNRTGVLCGQCHSGLSLMLGSNKCSECSNISLILIIVFFAAGILLIVMLIAFNLNVSSGKINALLFYANIVKLNEPNFFPDGNILVVSQFISWLNLDFGIETCLFDGLDGYWKTWLQFAFPFYLWLLMIAIIIGCRHSIRLSRLCSRNAVPVLATVLLMSYTKLLRNITSAMMFLKLSCDNYGGLLLWSVDPNINYFSTKHIILVVFSAALLIAGIVFTLLVFSSQWLQRYSHKCCKSKRDPVVKLKPLIDAYCGPYKDDCRYWTGLQLMMRSILTAVFSYTSSMGHEINSKVIIGIVLMIYGLAWTKGGIYKNKWLNGLELFFMLNICFISLNGDSNKLIVLISVGSTIFVSVIIFIHSLLYGHECIRDACKKIPAFNRLIGKDQVAQPPYIITNDYIPDSPTNNTITQREELIYF